LLISKVAAFQRLCHDGLKATRLDFGKTKIDGVLKSAEPKVSARRNIVSRPDQLGRL